MLDGKPKEGDNSEDLSVDGKIIIRTDLWQLPSVV
jgi:hypothetical protein